MKEFQCKTEDPEGYMKFLNCAGSKLGNESFFKITYEFEHAKDVFAYKLNTAFGMQNTNKKQKNAIIVFYNFTNINGCELLRSRNLPMLFNKKDTWNLYGKLPKSCPVRKNIRYFMEGFALPAIFLRFLHKKPILFWFDMIINNHKVFVGKGQIDVQKLET